MENGTKNQYENDLLDHKACTKIVEHPVKIVKKEIFHINVVMTN